MDSLTLRQQFPAHYVLGYCSSSFSILMTLFCVLNVMFVIESSFDLYNNFKSLHTFFVRLHISKYLMLTHSLNRRHLK